MTHLDPVSLGISLLVLGAAFLWLIHLALRAIPRLQPLPAPDPSPPLAIQQTVHNDAVMLVKNGGRVVYINEQARELFNLWDEEPNLERLARRARPSDAFIGLCAGEGQAPLSLNGRYVEATSYYVPNGSERSVLVSFRRPQLVVAEDAHSGNSARHTFGLLTELSQSMAASLDLEATLSAVLEGVERLIPSDFSEVTVWDAAEQQLVPYRFAGSPGIDRHIEKGTERYRSGQGYSGYLLTHPVPLLVADVDGFHEARPLVDRQRFPFRSYLGVPLQFAGGITGTLELASLSEQTFSQNDVEVLGILAGQAAAALHNALLYEAEQKRAQELSGLANLAQAISALRDPQDMFAHLVETAAPLIQTEVIGFLVYDENHRLLKGQLPFQGIPPDLVEWYQVNIPANSPAEAVWRSQEMIFACNPLEDERLQALGLQDMAQIASMRQAVLAPLNSAGRTLGYLQVANKKDGSAFDQDDLRLLAIIAGQVAPIIENANLVQISRKRAQRAETLRRIASLTGSTATPEEVLKYSLVDLARLLQADVAVIYIKDSQRGELRLNKRSMFGITREQIARFGRIYLSDPLFPQTVTGSMQYLICDDLNDLSQVLPLYHTMIAELGLRSLVSVPLVVRDQGIGELWLGGYNPGFFNRAELNTILTCASQLANAIEHSAIFSQTDQNLRQRVEQLTAITRVSRELNSTLHLESLLRRVYDEALATTKADCGTILLFELDPQNLPVPEVKLHLGDAPQAELHPLERYVLAEGESLMVEDFEHPSEALARLFDEGTLHPAHAGVRSALVVPVAYLGQVAGLIHLHARKPLHFDASARDVVETLAIQAAIALGNATRYQEQVRRSEQLSQRVETLSKLLETSHVLQAEESLDQALEAIAYAIQETTPFDVVLISVYEVDSGCLQRTTSAGIPLHLMAELKANPQPWEKLQQLLTPEFRLNSLYFIPHEQMPVIPGDIHTVSVLKLDNWREGKGDWHPDDMLLVPLMAGEGQPLGLISVDSPRDNRRPGRAAIETLEIFSSQAALVIENHRKLMALKRRLQATERELEQMLGSEGDLNVAIVHQRARRISAGLDIAALINRQSGRSEVLLTFAQEILKRMEMDAALVVEPSPGGPRLLHALGQIPPWVKPEPLLGQRNPLRHSLQTGEAVLVSDLERSSDWRSTPLLHALGVRALICLPVLAGEHAVAAILAVRSVPLAPFGEEDEQLFNLLARQAAIALQNLDLLEESRRRLREVDLLLDFSRQLGSLDQDSVLHSLVESAIHVLPAADRAMVALWDAKQTVLAPRAAAGYANLPRLMETRCQSGEALAGRAFQAARPIRLDEVDFARHYAFSSENSLRYRDATAGRLPISSMAIPITGATQSAPLGVLVLENMHTPQAFSEEDQALIASLALQTALTLENARLYQASEQRARQLQALTGIAAAITSSLRIDELIATLLDQVQAILPYDTGTLWLRQGDRLLVQAARGFEDSEQRTGLSVAVEDSRLLGEMVRTGLPIAVGDMRGDARFTTLLEYQRLSWLGIPLIASGEVIGVIALEKTEPDFYTPEHVQLATTFAGQAAVSLENAGLYQESVKRAQELDERTQTLAMLNRLSSELSRTLDLRQILTLAIQELFQVINCSQVSAILFNSDGQASLQAEFPRDVPAFPFPLPEAPLFERLRQTSGVFMSEDISGEPELAPLAEFLEERHTRSLLVLPMGTGNELHGLLLAHYTDGYRFAPNEVELARTISNQVAIAVQNARLFAETRSLSEYLEQRVKERTAELAREHQRTETLLRIITELSSSLDLDQVLNQTLHVLNEIIDAEQITVLIARPGEKHLRRLASVGYTRPVPSGGDATPFTPGQGLAGWVIAHRQAALIDDVSRDARWVPGSEEELNHRSAMAVPLMIGPEALGALLFYHRQAGHFSPQHLDLVQAAANQVAVAVNNAELYRLIRDQAEDLGLMLRTQQVENSRSKAILEAVADGVLVTDAQMQITLFNASAETLLGLKRAQVVGKSLETFAGLFGKAAQSWRETISTWSQDPNTYRPGDTYSEQITLEDGRVVSVRLAPVILRNDFLGTVSIFQDITHQVEVDRLKSEFVATVSHELRTPMTSIKGYVEVLLMGAAGPISEQQTQFLEVVKANTERLAVLVNDLLDISRIEAGRVLLSIQPLNLEDLAQEIIANLERQAEEEKRPVRIELDIPHDLPRVLGDLDRVRQILENLLDNAYQYNTPNGLITLHMRQAGEQVRIDVQDTGMGIPLDEQEHVFERFYRGESPLVLGVAGTGLGLSIVQNLVEMHNGRIWLDSSGIPGEGSTFSFTLPVYTSLEG